MYEQDELRAWDDVQADLDAEMRQTSLEIVMEEVLRRMPARGSEALRMAAEGLSDRDIAADMGVSVDAVYTWRHRARKIGAELLENPNWEPTM